ncbi:MAG: hypothetical protein V3T70_02405, partial [Phycisphaerae bacterium]
PTTSERRLKIRVFLAAGRAIWSAGTVVGAELPEAASGWLTALQSAAPPADSVHADEVLWLVARYLFQADRRPGIFIHARCAATVDQLLASIRVKLLKSARRRSV